MYYYTELDKMQYSTDSVESLKDLASIAVGYFKPGFVLFLEGPVGIGKSEFVKEMLNILGIKYAGSPTFGLINHYKTDLGYDIVHVDLYRDRNILDHLIEYDNAVFLIEWPSLSDDVVRTFPNAIRVVFSYNKDNRSCKWIGHA